MYENIEVWVVFLMVSSGDTGRVLNEELRITGKGSFTVCLSRLATITF